MEIDERNDDDMMMMNGNSNNNQYYQQQQQQQYAQQQQQQQQRMMMVMSDNVDDNEYPVAYLYLHGIGGDNRTGIYNNNNTNTMSNSNNNNHHDGITTMINNNNIIGHNNNNNVNNNSNGNNNGSNDNIIPKKIKLDKSIGSINRNRHYDDIVINGGNNDDNDNGIGNVVTIGRKEECDISFAKRGNDVNGNNNNTTYDSLVKWISRLHCSLIVVPVSLPSGSTLQQPQMMMGNGGMMVTPSTPSSTSSGSTTTTTAAAQMQIQMQMQNGYNNNNNNHYHHQSNNSNGNMSQWSTQLNGNGMNHNISNNGMHYHTGASNKRREGNGLYCWAIRDEGSTYGTYVNNEKIQPGHIRILKHEDVITLGANPESLTSSSATSSRKQGPKYRFLLEEKLLGNGHSTNTTGAGIVNNTANTINGINNNSNHYNNNINNNNMMMMNNGYGNNNNFNMNGTNNNNNGMMNNNNNNGGIKQMGMHHYQQQQQQPSSTSGGFTSAVGNAMSAVYKRLGGRDTAQTAIQKLNAELMCPICQSVFVYTSTLACGHSYCSKCINEWLRSCQACPVCRAQVLHPPVKSRIVDSAVEITLEHNADEATRQDWLQRKQQATVSFEKQVAERNTLTSLLSKAVGQGYKVVSISTPWSEPEQARFIENIKQYEGEARIGYCAIVGLTSEFVLSANVKDLITAAKNVRLTDKSSACSDDAPWHDTCVAKLRSRMNMYIHYG